MQIDERFLPIGAIDQIVPIGDLVIDRTAFMTIGNTAIHATRGLALHFMVIQGNDEFPEITDSVAGRQILSILPIDFEKAL